MFIKFSYSDGFEELLLNLKDKYPKEFLQINGISDEYLDITKYSKNYFKKKHTADSTMDQNANVQANHVATYHTERFKGHSKLNSMFLLWDMLKKLYGTIEANRLIELEFNKALNMQDSYNSYLPYCYNFSTYDLLLNGLPFIETPKSCAPKHAGALLQQTIQMTMFAANQLLGATSIGDVLIIYSYLLQKDSLDKDYYTPNYKEQPELFNKYLKQELQQFIFTINQPVRQSQSIFTNITLFDSLYLNEVKKLYFFEDKELDVEFTMFIQKEFLKYFIEFNKEQIFTFPVLTAQFKIDESNEVEDSEFFDFIAEMNTHFANINIFASHYLTSLSSCCRLINNVEDILKAVKEENTNLIGGASLKVGSFGVTSINLPRISYEYKNNEEEFFKCLEERVVDVIKINNARRELIKGMIEKNQLPLYNHNFMKLESQYSTVGILGFYECIEILNKNILDEDGINFGIKILEVIKKVIDKKIEKHGYKINCEAIPGESTAIKFAEADKLLHKQNDYYLYSNQFVPLIKETNIFDRIKLQAEFEKYFSGGTILHLNLGEKINSVVQMKKLISFTIKQGVQYHAINYFFSQCEDNHICVTKGDVCLICGKNIKERYTRIVGFIVKISSWAKERRDEFTDRKIYNKEQIYIRNEN
jgi:ribonucleoside-triphosphate reductase